MSGSVSIDDSDFTATKMQETELASVVLGKLVKEFPGYNWHVEVCFQAGVCRVRTEFGGQWGYVLHLDKIVNDVDMKAVRWAGGELLERYNLSRSKADEDSINSLLVDARGFAIVEK